MNGWRKLRPNMRLSAYPEYYADCEARRTEKDDNDESANGNAKGRRA